MTLLATAYSYLYQFGDSFAYLTLSSLGLAIIFGMMGVINLAHGEFVMCGAYVTILSAKAGLPLPLAMLAGAVSAAAAGAILERLIVRHLYNRLFDSIVATWAVSLITQQAMLIFAGPSIEGLSTPFHSFEFGEYSFSTYRALLPFFSIAVLAALYALDLLEGAELVSFESALAAGGESPNITRTCTFTFTAAPPAGSTVTSGWANTSRDRKSVV